MTGIWGITLFVAFLFSGASPDKTAWLLFFPFFCQDIYDLANKKQRPSLTGKT